MKLFGGRRTGILGKAIILAILATPTFASADSIIIGGGESVAEIAAIHESLSQLEQNSEHLSQGERRLLIEGLDQILLRIRDLKQQLRRGGGHVGFGGWMQVNGKDCTQTCRASGLVVGLSPEGASCTSGEVRPVSARLSGIQYLHGTWGQETDHVQSSSSGRFCYAPGQKRDNDRTDVTVGCFCN
jgi:hypothetical protein